MRKSGLFVFITIILTLAFILASCAKTTPTPTPAPAPAPKPSPAPAPSPTATPTPAPAPKESVADFYKKNTVTLIVPHAPGGGIDYTGRIFAAIWPDITGGTLRVQNMPGGGGITAANALYKAKNDGLTILAAADGSSLIAPTLFKDKAVQFKVGDFRYLGEIWIEASAFTISSKLPYKSVADMKGVKGLRFGGTVGTPAMGSAVVSELWGLDAKVVTGYDSGGAVRLAVAKGEIDGCATSPSALMPEIQKGWIKEPLVVIGKSRSGTFPNAPTVYDLMKPTAEQEKMINLFLALKGGRAFLAPPGVADDKMAFLRDAYNKVVTSKGFIEFAKKDLLEWPEPMGYKELEDRIKQVISTPQAEIDAFQKTMDKYMTK